MDFSELELTQGTPDAGFRNFPSVFQFLSRFSLKTESKIEFLSPFYRGHFMLR